MLYRASKDCVALLEAIGTQMRNVVPRYKDRVNAVVPKAEFIRPRLKVFVDVWTRICSGDLRIAIEEVRPIEDFAQWLAELDDDFHVRIEGMPSKNPQFTINPEHMIVRERIMG